ncbi:hypothetical protein DL98DRAFT_166698 [Cadophora sp. DSE1049]|nr:hypothetical protein DL98DRAFT_166698 [Cadophora sp. DSE1049]
MYRMMLAGAVLARAFHELFKRAEKEGRTEFRDKFSDLQCGKELASKPTEEDIEYLRQFPVYNFDPDDDTDVGKWKDQEYEKTFGPFADWLIKAGRVRGVQDKMTYSDCDLEECLLLSDAEIEFDEPTQGVLWELVLSMGACEHSDINQATTSANSQYDSDSRPELMGKSREVMVVMFGTFQVEVITMPLNIDSQTNHYLTAHPLVSGRLRETELFSKAHSDAYTSPISIDICSTIEHLASKSRRAHGDLSDGHEPPHPLFHLFVSIAKKYCNSSFFPGTFDEAKESDYLSQIVWGGIFKTTEWYLPFERYRPASATADEQMGSTDVYFLSGIPHVLRLLKEFYSLPNSSCQIPG